MKKLLAIIALLALPAFASAQTITCSVSGATAKQSAQYSAMLAKINAERTAANLPTYANFNAHCAGMMLDAFKSWIETQDQVDAALVGESAKVNGDKTASAAHCAAAGVAAGCTKAQVACFVLTGAVTCKP